LIEAIPHAVAPLAVDWMEAGRVSLTGFVGVFLVLTLLYLITLLFGRTAQWVGWSASGKDEK
jgi:hypothetical protein